MGYENIAVWLQRLNNNINENNILADVIKSIDSN